MIMDLLERARGDNKVVLFETYLTSLLYTLDRLHQLYSRSHMPIPRTHINSLFDVGRCLTCNDDEEMESKGTSGYFI